jgi:hypothetical protein
LLVRGHQLTSDVALLAGLAVGIYGLAVAPRRPPVGGLWLGIGLGIAILSSGLYDPLMLVFATIGMTIASPLYRTGGFARCIAVAVAVAAPFALIWPATLYFHAPDVFREWFWSETWAPIAGLFRFGRDEEYLYYLDILPWFAWPAWPFAIWSLWVEGRDGLHRREVQLPVVTFVAFFLFLSIGGQGRDIYALPLLLPISLLASIALAQLPRGALNAYYWFTVMVATFFCMVAWLYFSAIEWDAPRRLADHMLEMQPAYVPQVHALIIALAMLFSIGWLVLVFNVKRAPERPFILWAAGLTTVWALVAMLLVAWIDTGKTYRSVVAELAAVLPPERDCVLSQGLGEPQRAMLDYFSQITTVRLENPGEKPQCSLLLTQDSWNQLQAIGAPWELIWEGRRPGDRQERYRLYRRLPL